MALTAAASVSTALLLCRASWDTNPSPKPANFNYHNRTFRPSPPASPALEAAATATLPAAPLRKEEPPASQLWNSGGPRTQKGKTDDRYLGYERWLPIAPKVKKPRSIYNAASLAYLGDCIYELYARRHFLFPPKSIDVYNEHVMAIVRCEAQDALLKKLMNEDYLTEEERDVLRWGKNITSSKTRTKKRAGVQVYSRASSLETLIGYLYLTDVKRLEDLMRRLGFSAGASNDQIVENLQSKQPG
uniref:Mini-ribonuclease 3 n=1 Tax=Anthurium amnicola TaxID=1678845 RepID=A0A1D1YXJ9_9ARAE